MGTDATAWTLDRDGVEVVSALVEADMLSRLRESCPEGRAGVRNPLAAWVEGRRAAGVAHGFLQDRFGCEPHLTRAILFDKREDANWHLPLHRDLTIAVSERADVAGFGPWSIKDGQPHVSPPAHVLANMATVRLHLDDANEQNGCLRVKPRTHLEGKGVPPAELLSPELGVPIHVRAGGAVIMRPLVLHGSERSTTNARRRVLHMEFAFRELPEPLEWASISNDGEPVER